jgi:hypothetical protein
MTNHAATLSATEPTPVSNPGRWLRTFAGVLASLVLALSVFTLRQVSDGEGHMRLSDAAFDENDLQAATLHARRAATAFAPGAPHVSRAYRRLEAIAVGAEASSRDADALAAWRAVRSAALETRHLWVAMPAQLARANDNIARLSARTEAATPEEQRRALQSAKAELLRDEAPSGHWLILLCCGFFAALCGLGWVGIRGVDRDGRLVAAQARWGVLLALVGVVLWAVSAWQA